MDRRGWARDSREVSGVETRINVALGREQVVVLPGRASKRIPRGSVPGPGARRGLGEKRESAQEARRAPEGHPTRAQATAGVLPATCSAVRGCPGWVLRPLPSPPVALSRITRRSAPGEGEAGTRGHPRAAAG